MTVTCQFLLRHVVLEMSTYPSNQQVERAGPAPVAIASKIVGLLMPLAKLADHHAVVLPLRPFNNLQHSLSACPVPGHYLWIRGCGHSSMVPVEISFSDAATMALANKGYSDLNNLARPFIASSVVNCDLQPIC